MIRNGLAVGLAIVLAGCGSSAPETLEEALAGAANYYNREGASIINHEIGATKMVARVEAPDMVVMRVEGIPTGSSTLDPQAMTKLMRPNICSEQWNRRVFEKGGRLKLEFVSHIGKELPAIYFAGC